VLFEGGGYAQNAVTEGISAALALYDWREVSLSLLGRGYISFHTDKNSGLKHVILLCISRCGRNHSPAHSIPHYRYHYHSHSHSLTLTSRPPFYDWREVSLSHSHVLSCSLPLTLFLTHSHISAALALYEFSHGSVNLFFISGMVKDKLMDLWGS
jgi:hypothetical protein